MTVVRRSAVDDDALCRRYDVALLDLDGVVYVGAQAIDGAPQALAGVREAGMRLAFVTNNAARPPQAVAQLLTSLGVPARPEEVITSAQAAAHELARMLPPGARVLVIGTDGLTEALRERGLTPVHSADDDPLAVAQGFSPSMDWPLLAEACIAIRRGVPWVATNLDTTVPSPRGPVLGNGSLVAAVRTATGTEPIATGKPDPTMHRETVERSGAHRPLVVGDRLDTDIEGANRAGCDSLLVLTGVTDAAGLLAAGPGHRPTYVAADLDGLLRPAQPVTHHRGRYRCGRYVATTVGRTLRLSTDDNHPEGLATHALQALCAAAWAAADERGGADVQPSDAATPGETATAVTAVAAGGAAADDGADGGGAADVPVADGPAAQAALDALGLG